MKQIILTPIQAKFYALVMDAALKDKELSDFLTTYGSGKSFVMEHIQDSLIATKKFQTKQK